MSEAWQSSCLPLIGRRMRAYMQIWTNLDTARPTWNSLCIYCIYDSPSESYRVTESKIRNLLSASLEFPVSATSIYTSHRLRSFVNAKCRPLVARFASFKVKAFFHVRPRGPVSQRVSSERETASHASAALILFTLSAEKRRKARVGDHLHACGNQPWSKKCCSVTHSAENGRQKCWRKRFAGDTPCS